MKINALPYFLLSILFYFISIESTAQSYRPFKNDRTYHFSYTPDKIYTLGIDSVGVEGADSVYYFNKVIRSVLLDTLPCSAPLVGVSTFTLSMKQDNVFGSKMVIKPGGEYQFHTTSGDTFFIQTQMPLSSSWDFSSDGSITATYTSLSSPSFLGVVDSVQHISLSNGHTLQLSQNYGFVEAYSFLPQPLQYFDDTYEYELWGIKEIGLGGQVPGFEQIFDFDIGNEFGRIAYTDAVTLPSYGIMQCFWNDVIVGKTVAAGGDSLIYDVYREEVCYFESIGWYDTTSFSDTISVVYTREKYGALDVYSMQPFLNISPFGDSLYHVNFETFLDPNWNDRVSHLIKLDFLTDACEELLMDAIDQNKDQTYSSGLGRTWELFYNDPSPPIYEELVCYKKELDSAGTCVDVNSLLLRSSEELMHDFTLNLWPNPVQTHLSLEWNQDLHGKTTIKIMDGLGRTVVHHPVTSSTGTNRLSFELPKLPGGVYHLHLIHQGELFAREKLVISN